jgi:hypothetical protein
MLRVMADLGSLPVWLQFALTAVGGWVMGAGSVFVGLWRKIVALEKAIEIRLHGIEQTLYGPTGAAERGLVQQVRHADDGIARIEKVLVKICEHLDIPLNL